MSLRIHCQEPWFSKIRSGHKTVEGRKYNDKYLNLKSGDLLEFYCDDQSFVTEVIEVKVYKTVEEYLEAEGYQNVLPGVSSFAAAVDVYLQYNTREELNNAGGFLGIHIKLLRIVEIVPYDPSWPQQFAEEKSKIQAALGQNCIDVHHIGSTSVPGLSAKPVLDIMPVVHDITHVNIYGLGKIGYKNRGELGMPFRIYMSKGRPQHTHHLHIWEQVNPEIKKHLMFRDFLINNEVIRQEYADLKSKLAQQYRNEHRIYTTLKDAFIKNVIVKTGFNGLTIVQPLHAKEFEEYHRISKKEIFDPLPNIVYDPNHPTMTDPDHSHFILMLGVTVIGIAQVEMLDAQTAVLRMLAIDQPYQQQGYGNYLLKQMERWMASKGKIKILMHAAKRAENFYRKRGYIDMEFDDVGINADHVDLGKYLHCKPLARFS